MSEQYNSNWPHVIETFDELYAAEDAGFLKLEELGQTIEAEGGTVSYIAARVRAVLEGLGQSDLTVAIGEEKGFRGSGTYTPIEVKNGETVVTSFDMTGALGGAIPDALVGMLFIDDEGIQTQILRALAGE